MVVAPSLTFLWCNVFVKCEKRRFFSPLLFAAPAFQRHAREPKVGSQNSFKTESTLCYSISDPGNEELSNIENICPPVQSQNTRSETQEQRKWLSVQKYLQYVWFFQIFPSFQILFWIWLKSNRYQFLTQIESDHWKSGDRIIWVGSIWLDLDQDSLSEGKWKMDWLQTIQLFQSFSFMS